MTSRELVEIIEAELKRKGISKGDFYKACGISSGHMSNWRRELNYPQTPTLVRISEYLGINLLGAKTETPATGEGDGGNEASAMREEVNALFDSLDSADRARLLAFAQGLKLSQRPPEEGTR